ncbi:unnamed protein product [Pleuronectes platessa]|uniref:Uncharacterized protein n=1 Tax=Pleuronectes platessa TaxID=8262 RepID=A0A9N7W3K3_PLEPL|nr:unnamed protein product [Pleuronectes platessa]
MSPPCLQVSVIVIRRFFYELLVNTSVTNTCPEQFAVIILNVSTRYQHALTHSDLSCACLVSVNPRAQVHSRERRGTKTKRLLGTRDEMTTAEEHQRAKRGREEKTIQGEAHDSTPSCVEVDQRWISSVDALCRHWDSFNWFWKLELRVCTQR